MVVGTGVHDGGVPGTGVTGGATTGAGVTGGGATITVGGTPFMVSWASFNWSFASGGVIGTIWLRRGSKTAGRGVR